jgi:hypothetical protein
MQRGTIVTVRAFGDKLVQKRVWRDSGEVVQLTYEDEYQRAVREKTEAEAPGWHKSDIVEVRDN